MRAVVRRESPGERGAAGCRRGTSRFTTIVILSLLVAGPSIRDVRADDDEFRAKRDALVAEAATALSDFAHELHKMKLYKDRNLVAERLLAHFPDDKALRGWLDYRLDRKTGEWQRKKNAKPKKNYNATLAAEVPNLFKESVTPKLDPIWELLTESKDEISRGEYQRTLVELINLDPDDARFRGANGEVLLETSKRGTMWILIETHTALERRKELADFAAEAKGETPEPTDADISDEDLALGVTWALGVETPLVKVITSAGYSECVEVARACHASSHFFQKGFDVPTSFRRPYTVCLLQFPGQKNKIIDRMDASEGHKAFLRRMAGFSVPPRYIIQAEGRSFESQKDGAVRRHVNSLLRRQFGQGIANPPGIHQGLGLYLTYKLIGTRLTVFVEQRESRYAADDLPDTPSLEDNDADWVYVGHKWDEAGRLPLLTTSFALPLNDLRTEDLLFSYCFGRYVVEGRPNDAKAFLSAVGGKSVSDVTGIEEASIETLGLTLLDLDRRVRRWMSEMALLSSD